MEQTAVKKLELKLLGIISFDSEELRKKYKDAINQAKAMEKEQIEKTFKQAQECAVKADGVYFKYESFEQYYKETFKSE